MTLLDEVAIASPSLAGPWRHLHQGLRKAFKGLEEICGIRGYLAAEQHGAGVLLVCQFKGPSASPSADPSASPAPADDPFMPHTLCRQWLGDALAEFLALHWEAPRLQELAAMARPDLNGAELALIGRNAQHFLVNAEGEEGGELRQRREFIRQCLLDYLQEHDQIHLEGFVTFRLKEYVEWLEIAVEQALDDFLQAREYREFIGLLKIFVDAQPSRIGLVHVLRGLSGGFQLVDEDGQAIDQQSLANMVTGFGPRTVHYGDLLVSALISLAPRRVLLHSPGTHLAVETVETIKRVFVGRVHTCRGCRQCRDGQHYR